MTDLTKPFFGNPRETAKADKARKLRAVPYETTWLDEVFRGMFGAEEPSGSVLEENREVKANANSAGQALGIATDLAGPLKAAAIGAIPALGGIIGGPLAKSALVTPKNISRAEEILTRQGSPGYAFQETGLVPTPLPGGKRAWGPQIYDGNATLNPEVLQQLTPAYKASGTPLPELLDHPELYEVYPHLKDLRVNSVSGWDRLSGIQGGFSSRNNQVQLTKVNEYMPKETASRQLREKTGTLIHELQHGVQNFEHWPRGGNTAEFSKPSTQSAAKILKNQEDELRDILTGFQGEPLRITPRFLIEKAQLLRRGEKLPFLSPPLLKQVEKLALDKDMLEQAQVVDERLKSLRKRVQLRRDGEFSKYQSLAGEVQARAVQKAYMDDASPMQPQTSFYDRSYQDLLFLPPDLLTLKR